ncbi:unnamed protein product [Linum trigynum]|uniref:J domain-containing protein n=1 Tax=Linum trigynum TaxID=586398 RepID=A0AAV2D0G4_9ROSI
MAFRAAASPSPQASYPPPFKTQNGSHHIHKAFHQPTTRKGLTAGRSGNRSRSVVATAAKEPQSRPPRAPPGVDTRIHWDNPDEGWIGGGTNTDTSGDQEKDNEDLLGDKFADLLDDASDSHYQFLGVQPEADLEEIKSAYRRLSKEYHPDTTSLPLKTASEKFMRLRRIYAVLCDPEKRRFYDWSLAQELASKQAEKMRMKLEDPMELNLNTYESVPDMVDRLGGKNLELSDQAMTALTFDALILVFAIGCIVYVLVFKEPYY